jgi:hypothetical protein
MTRQCAWCKTILGHVSLGNEGGVTHGICPSCSAQLLRQAGRATVNVCVSEPPRGEPAGEPGP